MSEGITESERLRGSAIGAPVPGPEEHTRSRVRISCVQDFESLWPRAEQWNSLVRGSPTATVFQTFEWQASWCRAFGPDVRLLVLLAESDFELVGIAPLMISRQSLLRRPRRVVEFIGSDSADYCDFILGRPDVLPLFLEWLIEHGDLWDAMDLSNIVDASPLLEHLPRFYGARKCPVDLRHLYQCPTRLLADPDADRKLLNKKSLRRHENWFRRCGSLEFRHLGSVEEALDHLPGFFDQHIRRWGPVGFPSRFLDERHRAFFRHLVELMLPSGQARLSVLLFNEKPLAYEFGFEYSDRYYSIKPTFEPDYADHSPGMVMLKYCMEDAMERGIGEFDLTVGEEEYKYRYANHFRHAYRARVFPGRFAYHRDRLMFWARGHVWNVKQRLRNARIIRPPSPASAGPTPALAAPPPPTD